MSILFLNFLLSIAEPSGFWEVALGQSFSVVLLIFAIRWFDKKSRYQENKIHELYKLIIQDKEQDKERLMTVIEDHNRVIAQLTQALQKILNK